jgi:hypothetical protein
MKRNSKSILLVLIFGTILLFSLGSNVIAQNDLRVGFYNVNPDNPEFYTTAEFRAFNKSKKISLIQDSYSYLVMSSTGKGMLKASNIFTATSDEALIASIVEVDRSIFQLTFKTVDGTYTPGIDQETAFEVIGIE